MTQRALHKILYVEDEPHIRYIARYALELVGGYTVTACQSGREALQVACELDPDLILLDVMMPNLDGPDTLMQLRKIPALAAKPVVFITAKTFPDDIEYLRSLGALEIIPKPFDPMQLPSLVRDIWQQHTTFHASA